MIIGFVGFHSSGKSDLCQYLESKFGWRHILKRVVLAEWSGLQENESAWTEWYRELYREKGSYSVMSSILSERIRYKRSLNRVILVDAIHTPDEWRAIKNVDPSSLLAGVFITRESRRERSSKEDLVLDSSREKYWHSGSGQCLLSEIEWSFCGIASTELRSLEADTLRQHLVKTGRIYDL
jgi:hypothetical protein